MELKGTMKKRKTKLRASKKLELGLKKDYERINERKNGTVQGQHRGDI